MEKQELTFNDLPQVVAQLRDEVMGLRALLLKQQEENRNNQVRDNRHKPMTVEEAAEYTRIPIGTLYMKLGDGTIPATKPGNATSSIRMSLTSGWKRTARTQCLLLPTRRTRPSSLPTNVSRTRRTGTINLIVQHLNRNDYEVT